MTVHDWFERAKKENFAVGAFNIDSFEIFKAVLAGAKNKKAPVIVQFSPGEVGYFGLKNIIDLMVNAREDYKTPIFLSLDHCKSLDICMQAVGMPGFDIVHFDGSDLELVENIKSTKKIVEAAHKKGILVEGEMDKIFGSSEGHLDEVNLDGMKDSYTDPKRALQFITETGVDLFAPVFGNVHGTFPNQPALDIDLLLKIWEAIPGTFLSLHGGSGIPAGQIENAIGRGKVVKVNVNTELRQAFRDALSEKMGEKPNELKFYDFTPEVILAVTAVVEAKIDIFGSAGKA